tara:strand:- start:2741 stop:5473 length:2733 start_codon:yes stop_codon:yes gene_type:complete
MDIHNNVTKIINNTKLTQKQIDGLNINPDSNFVVVTYWWGRGNMNRNVARPCTNFYEDYLKQMNNHMMTLITKTMAADSPDTTSNIFDLLETNPERFKTLFSIIKKMVMHHLTDLCNEMRIPIKSSTNTKLSTYDRYDLLKEKYPELANPREPSLLGDQCFKIIKDSLIKNKENLIKLVNTSISFDELKKNYNDVKNQNSLLYKEIEELKQKKEIVTKDPLLFECLKRESSIEPLSQIDNEISNITNNKIKPSLDKVKNAQEESKNIKKELNTAILKVMKKKDPLSTFDKLIALFEYKPPIKFEAMIENWEEQCRKNGCNYLAVEYNEFVGPDNYQLAINAKPKFIQKVLELCNGKNILYIDGDMTIRQYPGIFDMQNIDFMARGWYVDPRSSYKMEESIMYDPYSFETSGGIMFFANTNQAKKLIQLWINTAEKKINDGKADDRVLSLVFNTKAVMTWVRIIQLPVEYLWLTLDYDERMMDMVYDYDEKQMESTIMVDHPECLTSEDTASGAGASSDRQPKFSSFLEDLTPCEEVIHEYILFKDLPNPSNNKFQAPLINYYDTLKQKQDVDYNGLMDLFKTPGKIDKTMYFPYFFWYHYFMGDVHYLDDGNSELVEMGFVEEGGEPQDNVQPLSIIPHKDKFGKNIHPAAGEGMSFNKLVDTNIQNAIGLNLESLYEQNNESGVFLVDLEDKGKKYVIINIASGAFDTPKFLLETRFLIKLILRILLDKKSVIFNPSTATGYSPELFGKLEANLNTIYLDIDFVFNPIYKESVGKTEYRRSAFYTPYINLHQSMLFRPESRLIDFISMCSSLDYLSNMIANGCYELISLTRCGFLLPSRDQYGKLPPNIKTKQYQNQAGGATDAYDSFEGMMNAYADALEFEKTTPTAGKKTKSRKKKLRIPKKSTRTI